MRYMTSPPIQLVRKDLQFIHFFATMKHLSLSVKEDKRKKMTKTRK